ncbi:MAG: MFS transporter [Calditrichia bacterium]
MKIRKDSDRRAIWGWALYDWANSAFATTVMAGFFPIFFKAYWSYGSDVNVSTAQLGLGNSLAGLIVALLGPVLGAISDRGNSRKKFLIFFAYLGVMMTAALFVVHKGDWRLAILFYAVGIIGFSGANIFYDSLLPHIASEKNIDTVSGLGFSLGYLGGGLLFLLNVLMYLMPNRFGLPDQIFAVRFAFLTVAAWWGFFTIFIILWVKEITVSSSSSSTTGIIKSGFFQFTSTFRKVKSLKTVFLFLIAYFLYIDGVDTIVRMAVDYGLSIGFGEKDLIIALLLVQFVAFPAALFYSKLGEMWGVRKAIFLAIFIYMLITVGGIMMTDVTEFYLLAIGIGLVQGGIQALSRSYYARLIPTEQSGEFFGFYNMIGKFAVILGPALMGLVGLIAKSLLVREGMTAPEIEMVSHLASRWSIASILILFIAGAVLFYFVDEEKGKKELQELEGMID